MVSLNVMFVEIGFMKDSTSNLLTIVDMISVTTLHRSL